jgi:hypothetical protein
MKIKRLISLFLALAICTGLGIYTPAKAIETQIGDYLFDPETGTITGYLGMTPDYLYIPSKINDFSVLAIGENGFRKKNMQYVSIPTGVTSIGDYAFYDCVSLTSIAVPHTVQSIGKYAFFECKFSSFEIPQSITTINEHTFQHCINLTNIVIPDGVVSIGDYSFNNCTSLSSCIFKGNAPEVFGSDVFSYTASDFTIYYYEGKTGFTTVDGLWNGYICVMIPDADGDGIADDRDNAPDVYNPDQADTDGDGIADVIDNAPEVSNPDQKDTDNDGLGDVIDPDIDGDGLLNENDNAPEVSNPDQKDTDDDGLGDVIDPDIDGDGVLNENDNAPDVYNPDQADADDDGVADVIDNAPDAYNPDQADTDGDGIADVIDNAPVVFNPDQADTDGDGVADVIDNAPDIYNPDQADADGDGIGDLVDDDTIYGIIYIVDNAIEKGSLTGNGDSSKLDSFTAMLEEVKLKIEAGQYRAAINQLQTLYTLVDGKNKPTDLVAGEAADEIASYILDLIEWIKALL